MKITLISLHGLIRGRNPELGRDADTGGQVKYVLELARELSALSNVREVELLTRQIIDPKVSDDYAQLREPIADNAWIVRIPFGPKRYLRKESLWPYIEMFIDQTLPHFKRTGLPDVIHGHYADAGLAGVPVGEIAPHTIRVHGTFAGTRQATTAVFGQGQLGIARETLQVYCEDRSRRDRVGNGIHGRGKHKSGSGTAIRTIRSLCPVSHGSDPTWRGPLVVFSGRWKLGNAALC